MDTHESQTERRAPRRPARRVHMHLQPPRSRGLLLYRFIRSAIENVLGDRQEITWTFECPIAPHLGSLLNRNIRDVERLRLWCRSIGANQYGAHLDPKLSNLFLADPLPWKTERPGIRRCATSFFDCIRGCLSQEFGQYYNRSVRMSQYFDFLPMQKGLCRLGTGP